MTRYFIVYDDLSVHDSQSGDYPSCRGIQVIVQQHPDVGWHVQTQYDFYIRRDGRWVGVDRAGLWDYLEGTGLVRINVGYRHEVLEGGKWVTVDELGLYKWLEKSGECLFGRTLTTKKFNEAMKRALKIWDVQREKSGYLAQEVRL